MYFPFLNEERFLEPQNPQNHRVDEKGRTKTEKKKEAKTPLKRTTPSFCFIASFLRGVLVGFEFLGVGVISR